MDNRYLYVVLTLVALNTGLSMFYLPKDSLKEMFVTWPWKANDDCLIQYEKKIVSILDHIMAEQAAKGHGAIETAPSIESHDIGDKVEEKTTKCPLGLDDSTPASTSTCATTSASVDTFGNRCYCNVDHFRRGCHYNEGSSGGSDLSDHK